MFGSVALVLKSLKMEEPRNKTLNTNVHTSIYNNFKLKPSQVSISRRMNMQTMVCSFNGIPLDKKKTLTYG